MYQNKMRRQIHAWACSSYTNSNACMPNMLTCSTCMHAAMFLHRDVPPSKKGPLCLTHATATSPIYPFSVFYQARAKVPILMRIPLDTLTCTRAQNEYYTARGHEIENTIRYNTRLPIRYVVCCEQENIRGASTKLQRKQRTKTT